MVDCRRGVPVDREPRARSVTTLRSGEVEDALPSVVTADDVPRRCAAAPVCRTGELRVTENPTQRQSSTRGHSGSSRPLPRRQSSPGSRPRSRSDSERQLHRPHLHQPSKEAPGLQLATCAQGQPHPLRDRPGRRSAQRPFLRGLLHTNDTRGPQRDALPLQLKHLAI